MWQKLYATGTATTREAMHNWLHAPRIVIGTEPTEKQKDRFAKDGIQLKYLTSVYRFEWEHLTCIGREYNEAVICCNGNDAKELVSALNTLFRYANLNVRAISGIA